MDVFLSKACILNAGFRAAALLSSIREMSLSYHEAAMHLIHLFKGRVFSFQLISYLTFSLSFLFINVVRYEIAFHHCDKTLMKVPILKQVNVPA